MDAALPVSSESAIRVLHVIGDPVGGIRRHVHALIHGMLEAGLDVGYVYSASRCDSAFASDLAAMSDRLVCSRALRMPKRPSWLDISNTLVIARLLRRHRIQVVHGHGAKGGLYARLAGRLTGARVIYTPHGGTVHAMFPCGERRLYRMVERLLRGWTDRYLFESRYSAEGLLRHLGTEGVAWSVNPNGIPRNLPMRDVRGADGRPLALGVFGMLRGEKGQHLAIEAVARLQQAGLDVTLHLFGDGPELAAWREFSRTLGCEAVVVFHGDVRDALAPMRDMDLVVVPSLFESFGYAALEALAQGVPAIAARVGGLPEIFDGELATLLYEPDSALALVEKVEWFAARREAIEAMVRGSAAGLRDKFSEPAMVQGVLAAYEQLVREPASHRSRGPRGS